MPNRIIKESICTSENVDQLTPFQETVFVRLMVNCDDFGRFDGRAKILSSRLFPLKNITPEEMETAVDALVKADLATVYQVDGKPYICLKTWDKHQQTRASKSKYPSPDESNCEQLQSIAINCNQLQSDDSKCTRNRNRNRNTIIVNRNRNTVDDDAGSLMDESEAQGIADEQAEVLDAAERAGFDRTQAVFDRLVALYADHGKEKMMKGIEQCVVHGAVKLAYLEAVLSGKPKQSKPSKTVVAQEYEQRDYTDLQKTMEQEQRKRFEERIAALRGNAV